MEIQAAKRLSGIGEYYFSAKLREIETLRKAGKDIVNLGIGSPDLPPHPSVIATLTEHAQLSDVHGYQSYKGAAVLRTAMADWYQLWYNVKLDPEKEILPLIGSKEGIMHICMAFLNEGDKVLVPNPGYPTYHSAVHLAGGIPVPYTLAAENDYAPDFAAIEEQGLAGVKLLFVNYPHMPTGSPASEKVFKQIVAFALKHGLIVIHDNPYSFILNNQPLSILGTEGAHNCVLELNSLSKSHNMAGWRMGMLVGREALLNEVLRFKSNMDSGTFLPMQLAATKALALGKEWFDSINGVYAERKILALQLFDTLGCTYRQEQVGMFIWGKVPAAYKDGYALSDKILYECNVFITPGGIFGNEGNDYVRISLCSNEATIRKALNNIANLKSKNNDC